MEIETKLAAAGLRLIQDYPYLATAFWAVKRIATPLVPTMAVDNKGRLYYNPETVLRWTVDEVRGVFYHELCHILRDHAGRGQLFDNPLAWNLACDAEINDDLRAEGVTLPDGAIYPAFFLTKDGLLAEEYYHAVPKLLDKATFTVGCGQCGSCATGQETPWEMAADIQGITGWQTGEGTLIRHAVAVAIQEHSRTRGTVPGHWQRWAANRLEPPKVNWRQELASLVRRAYADMSGATDYRYSRPSRRQNVNREIVFPSLRQNVPEVAVVVDTSGSISDGLLSAALSEVQGILAATGRKSGLTVMTVDAAVQTCRRVFDTRQIQIGGGGGTDMRVGLAAAERLKPRPEIVIVLTDGFTPWPPVAPAGMRVVVALLHKLGTVPSYAQSVLVEV